MEGKGPRNKFKEYPELGPKPSQIRPNGRMECLNPNNRKENNLEWVPKKRKNTLPTKGFKLPLCPIPWSNGEPLEWETKGNGEGNGPPKFLERSNRMEEPP